MSCFKSTLNGIGVSFYIYVFAKLFFLNKVIIDDENDEHILNTLCTHLHCISFQLSLNSIRFDSIQVPCNAIFHVFI